MRRLTFLILLFLLTLPLTAFQGIINIDDPGPNTWFFAWEPVDIDGIVAFNTEGESNVVINGVEPVTPTYRIDDQTILMTLEYDAGTRQFVRLTPDSATPMGPAHDESSGYILLDYAAPWALFSPVRPFRERNPILLLNVETGDWEILEAMTFIRNCCVFSDDGRFLRYIKQILLDENTFDAIYELTERDMNTGEERTIHSVTSDGEPLSYTGYSHNSDGSAWVERQMDTSQEPRAFTFRLIDLTGNIEELDLLDGRAVVYYYVGDDLAVQDIDCRENCEIILRQASDGELVRYPIFDENYAVGQAVRVDDVLLTLGANSQRLAPGTSPRLLFEMSRGFITRDPISPDGAYTYTIGYNDDGEVISAEVLDVAADTVVYDLPLDPEGRQFIDGTMLGSWMVMRNLINNGNNGLFNWRTGESYTFIAPGWTQLDVVDDSQIIIGRMAGNDPNLGLSLLDLESDEETLLLPGRHALISGIDLRNFELNR